jgi:hypothetical protein
VKLEQGDQEWGDEHWGDKVWTEPFSSPGSSEKRVAYCDEWVEWEEMPQEIEDSPPDLEQEVAETEVGPTSSKIQNRDDFVAAMLQDPDLPCERTVAIKVYNYLSEKLEAWGISLDAAEMRHQLKTFMPDHVMKDTPMGSKGFTCADVEKWHENWNSSDSLTPSAGSQWESSDDLEEKVARADPQDALMVATFHEINEEKKLRKAAHLEDLHPSPNSGVQSTYGQVAEKQVVNPRNNEVRWGPITKEGLSTFMAHFGEENPNVEGMDLATLVDYAVLLAPPNLPETIPKHIADSIWYIKELADEWGVHDIADFDYWLGYK